MIKKALLQFLMEWPSIVIRDQDLAARLIGDEQKRYDVVGRALKGKVLSKLKRGVYLILPPYQKYLPQPFEIAQTLYGPSYISFESALSHYGLIPEAVYNTDSACLKRSKLIRTSLGSFRYFCVPANAFSIGVKRVQENHETYLLATPWKALADLCYVQKKSWHGLADLCEDLRIEKENLVEQDPQILEELAQQYGSKKVRQILSRMK